MFRIGFAYKHVNYTDSFLFVTAIRETIDSVILDVGYWVQPIGWRPHNTSKYGQVEIKRKDFDKWTNYILGADRCSFRQDETLKSSNQ